MAVCWPVAGPPTTRENWERIVREVFGDEVLTQQTSTWNTEEIQGAGKTGPEYRAISVADLERVLEFMRHLGAMPGIRNYFQ